MSGQRRANWRAEAQDIGRGVEERLTRLVQIVEARVEAGEAVADFRRQDCADMRKRLDRAEFTLKLIGVALAIMIASAVIQAVSR